MNSSMIRREIARYSKTYTEISKRMRYLGVKIEDHIDESKEWPVRAWDHLLAGIEFDIPVGPASAGVAAISARNRLIVALDCARNAGRPAFRKGGKIDHKHFGVDASMAVTPGVGFREIFYFDQEARNRRTGVDSLSMRSRRELDSSVNFSAQFGGRKARVDLRSLHVAVLVDKCKIHVDHTGFVMEPLPGSGGDVVLSPDFLQHLVYELVALDIGNMPANIEIYAPNTSNNFSRAGMRATLNLNQKLRVTVDKSVGLWPKPSAAFTVSLSGEFHGP